MWGTLCSRKPPSPRFGGCLSLGITFKWRLGLRTWPSRPYKDFSTHLSCPCVAILFLPQSTRDRPGPPMLSKYSTTEQYPKPAFYCLFRNKVWSSRLALNSLCISRISWTCNPPASAPKQLGLQWSPAYIQMSKFNCCITGEMSYHTCLIWFGFWGKGSHITGRPWTHCVAEDNLELLVLLPLLL